MHHAAFDFTAGYPRSYVQKCVAEVAKEQATPEIKQLARQLRAAAKAKNRTIKLSEDGAVQAICKIGILLNYLERGK